MLILNFNYKVYAHKSSAHKKMQQRDVVPLEIFVTEVEVDNIL